MEVDLTVLSLQSDDRDKEYLELFAQAVYYAEDFSKDDVDLETKKVLLAKKMFCLDKLNTMIQYEGSLLQTLKSRLNDYPTLKTWHTKRVALVSDYTERIKNMLGSERDLSWSLYNVLKH